MATVRVLILRAPGTNCDLETEHAFRLAGAEAVRLHVNGLLQRPEELNRYQVLCIAGGFSYGDDLGAGAILAAQIRQPLAEHLQRFCQQDRLVLGICNGFQVLLRSGLLIAADQQGPRATLTQNDSARFEDRWVDLQVVTDRCPLLSGIERMQLPVAHAEGKFVARGESTLRQIQQAGQTALLYTRGDRPGSEPDYPHNPNGSQGHVAAVCSADGRMLGMMPHPERFVDFTQHPRWTRTERRDPGDGLRIFENAVNYFRW